MALEFNAARGDATFYTRSAFAQNFVICIINENLKLWGIKARVPRIESKPNFFADFPSILDKLDPINVLQRAISLNMGIECAAKCQEEQI